MSKQRRLTPGILLRCFLRSYLVGAAFNVRGMQNIGLVFAMEPGLRAIYPEFKDRQKARKRYIKFYNTHFFWTPALLGVFLGLERNIADERFPSQMLEGVKNTTVYTLSAIGDSVFGGSLLTFWSMTTVCMIIAGHHDWALAWALAWFAALHAFKFLTFVAGLREGLKLLKRLKRWDLINLGRKLKMVNAVVMTVFLYLAWPGEFRPIDWAFFTAALFVAAWMVSKARISREIVALALLGGYVALPWLKTLW